MPVSRLAGIVVLLVLAACFLVVIVRALRGVPWKQILAGLWSLLWKLALVAGVAVAVLSLLPRGRAAPPEAPALPPPAPPARAPLGPVPSSLLWVVGICVAGVVLALAARMVLVRRKETGRSWETQIMLARQALLNGDDLRDVVIRCYLRMADALQQERGIERESSMTTGEFEALLEAKGLPPGPVRALTRLFERARYSSWQPGDGEEQGALQCLETILESARRLPVGPTP